LNQVDNGFPGQNIKSSKFQVFTEDTSWRGPKTTSGLLPWISWLVHGVCPVNADNSESDVLFKPLNTII